MAKQPTFDEVTILRSNMQLEKTILKCIKIYMSETGRVPKMHLRLAPDFSPLVDVTAGEEIK